MGCQAWKGLLRARRVSPTHHSLRTAEHPQPEIHPGLKEGSVLGKFFTRKWDAGVVVSHAEDRTQKLLCSRQSAVPSSACSLLHLPQFYLAWAPRSRRHRVFPYSRLSLCGRGEPGRGERRGGAGGGQGEVGGGSRGRPLA